MLSDTVSLYSKEDERNSESLSQYVERSEFYDSIVVRRRNSATSNIEFGPSVKLTANVHNFTYGATQRNTLAAENIARINGFTVSQSKVIENAMRELSKDATPTEVAEAPAEEESSSQVEGEETPVAEASEQKDGSAEEEIIEITKEATDKVMTIISLKQEIAFYKTTIDQIFDVMSAPNDGSAEAQAKVTAELGKIRTKVGATLYDRANSIFFAFGEVASSDPRLAPIVRADLYDLKFTMSGEEKRKEILAKEVDAIWSLPIVE